jgi:hypothetical protein
MNRLKTALMLILFTIQINSTNYLTTFNHTPDKPEKQGGILGFGSVSVERIALSSSNSDSLILSDYTGLPMKALQFRIIVGKNGGKLKFKSLTRGSGIPDSSFLFDYHVIRGELNPDGSSIDIVSAVLLGWGNNVLMPGEPHHIATINYDVVELETENAETYLSLYDVMGATAVPIQDAFITGGEDYLIYLTKKNAETEIDKISLLQNYPNPFNPNTIIYFEIKTDTHVSLKIFNPLGEQISTLIDEYKPAGSYKLDFNASGLSSGVYLCQITTGSYITIKKMMLAR